MAKQKVILNPYPRPLDMVMSSQDAERLHDLVDVIQTQSFKARVDSFDNVFTRQSTLIRTPTHRHGDFRG